MTYPPSLEDVDCELTGAEMAVSEALTALRSAQAALVLLDYLELHVRLEAARTDLHAAVLALTAVAPEARRWADVVTDY